MTDIAFTKMHGLGNDFVVIDTRKTPRDLTALQAQSIADRHTGVGCDQLILLESPPADSALQDADIFMRIYNADGSEVDACGNATRCVADLIMAETTQPKAKIATGAGILMAEEFPDGLVAVDMGRPRFDWQDIPLSEQKDTLHLDIEAWTLADPTAVSMGNPHCVFFVDDAEAVPLDEIGPILEHHELFPERANIGIVQIKNSGAVRLRVWERGAGITQACGTGACAAAVAAHRRDLTGRTVLIELDGGNLTIDWRADDHVIMIGPTAISFKGAFNAALIEG
ncbi:MAG: diaminopimelate epimerase [Rhodospirillaceae bacterium]|nr:diaminopimelate epimerase [Rhodospirillaceae bacterium]|tara:strand:+ start:17305 stop:18153 length:849 start_codon:yes stop_codon:yes gene_type:complete